MKVINNTDITKYFDEASEFYMQDIGVVFQAVLLNHSPVATLDYLAGKLNLEKAKEVLDLGCGIGSSMLYYSKRYPSINLTGVTISSKQVEIGSLPLSMWGNGKATILEGDYHYTNLPSKKYDRIYLFESSCYSTDPTRLIAELNRLCNNDGVVLIKDIFLDENLENLSADKKESLNRLQQIYKVPVAKLSDIINKLELEGFEVEVENLDPPKWTMDKWFEGFTLKNGTLTDMGKYHNIQNNITEFPPVSWRLIKAKKTNEKL